MADLSNEKMAAAAKMAFGVIRMGSGIATGLGHGVVGGALKQRHMMQTALRIGKLGFEGGKRMFDEGLHEWNEHSKGEGK
jgi:hypothetical protein